MARAADEVVVVLAQRRQIGRRRGPQAGDVGALRVHAVDGVEPALPPGPMRHRQGQVAAAGLARHEQRPDAELVAVGVHPAHGGGAVIEAGRERVGAELAAGVAELDTDDDHAGGSQLVAQAHVGAIGGGEDRHAPAVEVDQARHAGRAARPGGG